MLRLAMAGIIRRSTSGLASPLVMAGAFLQNKTWLVELLWYVNYVPDCVSNS